MSKYDISSYKKKDGTIQYFVLEIKDTQSVGCFGLNICDTLFYGTKEECEKKIEELRTQE